jgi:Aldehyde dehydrogenase family
VYSRNSQSVTNRFETLDLVPLVCQERADEVFAKDPGKLVVGRQSVQRVPEPLRQHLGPRWVVAVALQLGGRLNLAGDAQVDGRADGGQGQVRVGGGVAEPHLHPRGGAPLGRDPDHGAAVVQAPVDQPRGQGVRAEPLVGVDGRVEQGAQRRRVRQHPADGVCLAGTRLLVDEAIAGEFTARFAVRAAALRQGDPRDEATDIGPNTAPRRGVRGARLRHGRGA